MANNTDRKNGSQYKSGQKIFGAADFYTVFADYVSQKGSDTNFVIVESKRILDAVRVRSGKKWKVNRLPVATALLIFANDFMTQKASERFKSPETFLANLLQEKANELHIVMHELFKEAAEPDKREELDFPLEYIPAEGLDNAGLYALVERELEEMDKIKAIFGGNMPKGLEGQCPAQFRKVQNLIKQQ